MEKFPLISELTEKQKNRMIYLLDKGAFRGPYIAKSIVNGEKNEYNSIPINEVFESLNLSTNDAITLSKEVVSGPSLDLQNDSNDLNVYPFGNTDLIIEFNRLGFDYPYELSGSVGAAGGEELSEMSYIKESNEFSPGVQALVIRFEVKNFMNGKRAHIEALTASFYKNGDIITPIVKKRFSEQDGDLPTKEEIFDQMITVLKAHYLEAAFSKLDFDHKLIPDFDTLNFENTNFQVLLLEKPDFRSYSFDVDGAAVLFTISQGKIPFIESLSAALYKETPDGKYEGTVQKDYFLKDGPLPKRADVYNDLTDMIRAQRIREIFKISLKDTPHENQKNHRKNRL